MRGPERQSGRRSALLIGTGTYDDPEFAPLRSPAADVNLMGGVLGTPAIGGFTVTTLVDRPVGELRAEVEEFLAGRAPDETVLVYFSGHGMLDPSGWLYLATRDTAHNRLASTALEAPWLVRRMDDCRAGQQILILDCCYSGGFAQGTKGAADERLPMSQLRSQGHGRAVLAASRRGQRAYEDASPAGEAAPSVFTAALAEGLRTGGADTEGRGRVEVYEAFRFAEDRVRERDPRQTPQLTLERFESDIWLARTPAPLPGDVRAASAVAGPLPVTAAPEAAPRAGSPSGLRALGRQGGGAVSAEVGKRLAQGVLATCEKAHGNRSLDRPIEVRWERSKLRVASEHPAGTPAGHSQSYVRLWPTRRAAADREGSMSEGTIHDLFDAWVEVNSGRVVVLGERGSGKSDAALLTVMRALEAWDGMSDKERAHCPVPVLLSIVGWEGGTLNDWVARRIAADNGIGSEEAGKLVDEGWIMLFVDGLDEIDKRLRAEAIKQLDLARYPLLVFSRPDEYAEAVKYGHLKYAVAFDLVKVATDDAVNFLNSLNQRPKRLIAHLEKNPQSKVSEALTKPLNLAMVRDAFPPGRIDALNDMLDEPFADSNAVEEYLLDRLVRIRYEENKTAAYPPEGAERWLAHLAREMYESKTYSFDWRRLHHVWDWVSPWSRIAMAGLAGLLVSVPGGMLAFGPGGFIAFDGRTGVGFGALLGVIVGTSVGCMVGLVSELRDPVPGWGLPRRSGTADTWRQVNWGAGGLVALVIGTSVGGNRFGVAGALASGLLTGTVAAFAAGGVKAAPGWTFWARWEGMYRLPVLAAGAVGGMCIGTLNWLNPDGLDPGYGALSGFSFAIVVVLMIGAARPASVKKAVTDPHTSWERERRYGLVSGSVFGFSLALAFAVGNVITEDASAWRVPFVTLGAGLPFGTAALVAISDHWRTTLLFLQLRRRGTFPLLGMKFLHDAYKVRRVLRAEGPHYGFRHSTLRDSLAHKYESEAATPPPPGPGTRVLPQWHTPREEPI